MIIKKADRIKKVFLKTLIIERECFNKFKKLICEGPKYLVPLIDGIDTKSFSTFLKEPEKLLQVAFSFNIFSIVDFDRQVKFPNLIDWPANAKVKNL